MATLILKQLFTQYKILVISLCIDGDSTRYKFLRTLLTNGATVSGYPFFRTEKHKALLLKNRVKVEAITRI